MASAVSSTFQIPTKDAVVDDKQMMTQSWAWFIRELFLRVFSLGSEQSFTLVNNTSTPTAITGLNLNQKFVSQAIIEFLIQRRTTSAGATALVESGVLTAVYRPATDSWQMIYTSTNSPDDSGVDFAITPYQFAATYDHTTSTWTKASNRLINGIDVTLTAGTSLPTGYSLATTYYVISQATDTFKLSATLGGAAVTAATNNGTGTLTVIPNHAADGQVLYISSNITGTASISKLYYRVRTLAGKNSLYSSVGGQ